MTLAVEEAKHKNRLVFTTDKKSPEYPLNIGGIDPLVVGVGKEAKIDYEQTIKHYNTIIKGAKKMSETKHISVTKRTTEERAALYKNIAAFIFEKNRRIGDIETRIFGSSLRKNDQKRRTLQYDMGCIKRASQGVIQCHKMKIWRIDPGYTGSLVDLLATIIKHMDDRPQPKSKADKPSKTHIVSAGDLQPVHRAHPGDYQPFRINFRTEELIISDFSKPADIKLTVFGQSVHILIGKI